MKYTAPEFNSVELEVNDIILTSKVSGDGTIGGLPEDEA